MSQPTARMHVQAILAFEEAVSSMRVGGKSCFC